MKMEVNSSGFAMGAVLLQKQENEWQPLSHISQTYNQAEGTTGQEIENYWQSLLHSKNGDNIF